MAKQKDQRDEAALEAARKRHFAFRLNVFFFCTFLLFSILIIRLAFLQFVEVDAMRAKENQHSTISTPIAPIRGNIYDRNEYPIAYTESTQSLFYRVEPGISQDQVIALAYRLEEAFRDTGDPQRPTLRASDIIAKMDVGYDLYKNRTKAPSYLSHPRRIKEGLTNMEIAYLLEHKDELRGLDIAEESIRRYDTSTIAVQLVGYLREYNKINYQPGSYLNRYQEKSSDYLLDEYVGFDGLEFMYQDVLRGSNGKKTYRINAQQKVIDQEPLVRPEKGHNLILSVDKDVQLIAEQAIMDHIEWLKSDEARQLKTPYEGKEAVAGYAVAMEIDTGHIVAMASMPDYDSNVWRGGLSTDDWNRIQYLYTNGTIRDRSPDLPDDVRGRHATSLVPLGSTIKPLTVLVGLNEGLFTATERFTDTGTFFFGRDNSRVRNAGGGRALGTLTASSAIRTSSNVFMSSMVGNRLYMRKSDPVDIWDAYMKQFGLGVSTGSGLPSENSGIIEYYTGTSQSALVYASFGQQGKYTVLQLAQYTTMLANKGKRLQPQFVQKITDYEGNVVEEFNEPIVLNEVDIPDEHWKTVQDGMLSNVQGFAGFPYDFRRKTGTSQSDIAGKLLENAVFIAYAPAQDPKLAVAVVVPEGGFGGWGAAPIARKIFDAYDQHIGLTGTPVQKEEQAENETETGAETETEAGAE